MNEASTSEKLLVRHVAKLEVENAELRERVAELEAKLAWHPVSAATMQTELGRYHFVHITPKGLKMSDVFTLRDSGWSAFQMYWDYTHYRRIELPT